jgi:ATP-dependent RNA helicase RhlE
MQFHDLKLIEPLLRAVQAEGYHEPTPIQTQAIPHILAGRDLIGCAQTGTGKTAAFALPILQRLAADSARRARGEIRVLVLSPTRELAAQIGDSFATYGRHTGLKHQVIYGGVGQNPQIQGLRRGNDILVATPGRLLDLMNQGVIRLSAIEIFVLDEADRMLDMGFIHDVRRVIKALPTRRQTLLFSATMPQAIQELADHILTDPVRVEVTPQATTVEKIAQSVFFVNKKDKRALLEHILGDQGIRRALVFTRTKHGANKLVQQLGRSRIEAEAIHSNKSQSARERALANFKAGRTRVLVATDIAARGIDVDDVTHVINFDLPNEPESYVHRIGRTARAGASGIAYSLCDADERKYLRDIEKLIRLRVPVIAEHPYAYPLEAAPMQTEDRPPARPANGQRRPANGNGQQAAHERENEPRRNSRGPRRRYPRRG